MWHQDATHWNLATPGTRTTPRISTTHMSVTSTWRGTGTSSASGPRIPGMTLSGKSFAGSAGTPRDPPTNSGLRSESYGDRSRRSIRRSTRLIAMSGRSRHRCGGYLAAPCPNRVRCSQSIGPVPGAPTEEPSTGPRLGRLDRTEPEKSVSLRTLGDCLDSLERAKHVPPVATLPHEPPERAPELGEDVVPEVE